MQLDLSSKRARKLIRDHDLTEEEILQIVASARIYGGSHNMFTHTLPRFGITTTLVDPRDPASFERAITGKTRYSSCLARVTAT